MEFRSLKSSTNFYSSQRLGYLNRCNSTNYFQRQTQRLIPLTREIENTMINFNGSESGTSVPDRAIFNTVSLMTLITDEVYNILQQLPISEQIIRRKEIDDIIKKRLQDCETKLEHVILHNANDELEITVKDITEDQNVSTLIVERIQKLEDSIIQLEKRLKFLLKNLPKSRLIQAKKFKTKINAIKDKLTLLNGSNSQINKESLEEKANKNVDQKVAYNIYDELFYTARQYSLNILHYKKSLESMKLNERSKWNPYVKPTCAVSLPKKENENLKQLSMFITS